MRESEGEAPIRREGAQRPSQTNGASAPARASEAVGESEGRSPSDNFGTATGFRERLDRLFHWDSCVNRLDRVAPGAKNRQNNGPLKKIEDLREAGALMSDRELERYHGACSRLCCTTMMRAEPGRL